jgi:hypothetical protein
MSHRKLLFDHLAERIEAGAYKTPGTPRPAKPATDKQENAMAPKPVAEPAKRPEASPEVKRGTPDHASFVESLALKRRTTVGNNVQTALDEKFKGKK